MPHTSVMPERASSDAHSVSRRAMPTTMPFSSADLVREANVTSGDVNSVRTSVLKSKWLLVNTPATRTNSGSSSTHDVELASRHSFCVQARAKRGCLAMASARTTMPLPVTGAEPSAVNVACAGMPAMVGFSCDE